MTHNPDNISMPFTSEETTILGEGKSETAQEQTSAGGEAIGTMNALMEIDILADEYRDQFDHGHMAERDYRKVKSALTVLRSRVVHCLVLSEATPPINPPVPEGEK